MLDVLDATVLSSPLAPALDADGTVLVYRALRDAADATAARLSARGVGPGDRVGVRVPSGTAELYTAILGVLRAGAAYVPVDVDDPDERAELIWRDAGVRAVLGPDGELADGPGAARPRAPRRPPTPDDDAWVIFTSGTTGRPKGVAVTHRSAAAFVDAEAELFLQDAPLGRGDRVLAGLSVAFDASCEEMWLAWRHGACLVPAPRALVRAGAELGPWLVRRGITVVSTVPTLAALWPAEALDAVRLLIVGGEACPAELVQRLDVPGREFWNTYGPTETTVVACASRMRAGQPVRIGTPLNGWEVAVVDPAGHPVPWGGTGELLISGVGTARYLDRSKDAEKFRPHPALPGARVYRSGDLVRADRDGLAFVGRADEQVKLGGRRIELGEVDAALAALPGVRAAAAAVQQTPGGGHLLVGYLVPDGDDVSVSGPLDLTLLRQLLRQRLPAALVPVLAELAELPTRTSGKVDRKALPWPPPRPSGPGPGSASVSGSGPASGTGAELHGTAARLAGQWRDLLGVDPDHGSDFFALGGTSLAAARLVSLLRQRHPGLSVADLYRQPRLGDLAAHLDRSTGAHSEPAPVSDRAAAPEPAAVPPPAPVPAASAPRLRLVGLYQAAVLALLHTLGGLRWVLALAAAENLLPSSLPWTLRTSWWLIAGGWLLLSSALGRTVIGAVGARLLTRGLRPGSYPRGGPAHLRLWTAERLVGVFNVASVLGTPLAGRYARMLGCRVGADVALHTMPPVTGLAAFGSGCSLEPEVDAAGWWLEGDRLHLGTVSVGPGARVGTRSTLMPGAEVGPGAEVAPGSCVTGAVPGHARWHGSPARPDPERSAWTGWPVTAPAVTPGHRRRWHAAYALSLPLLQLLPLVATVPGLLVLYLLMGRDPSWNSVFDRLLLSSVPLALFALALYALLLAGLVRLLSRSVTPGLHPALGRTGWSVWVVHQLMGSARSLLFPLYASLATPAWLRLLGARVGRRVEASTVLALPGLIRVDDYAFLADDTLLAPFQIRGGWLRLGTAGVGRRSFVGNSGIVGPGRELPDDSLVGVLSDAPPADRVTAGASWLGRPGFGIPRVAETGDAARTYEPPSRLVLARASVELCRLVPTVLTVLLGDLAVAGLQELLRRDGLTACVLGSGPLLLGCGAAACLVTTAAKWLLLGRFRTGRQPLWSSFVWRNELFDVFVEELAMPWLGSSLLGTPFLTAWLRSLGARIGRGVWCETHWLPETDLVRLGEGCSVNRGVVLQTHLFHDRLMRMDGVDVGAGATVGPHSIVLLGAGVGDGAVVGPASLVMRGEALPAGTRWLGNPVAQWS
ncbi:Pls/PosA family non-ribosomal peptide synthetase [Streptacidiphilus carbonis]|uniref:Pls/PosA family non-ribosomal peptide synthetase n=1 Tax=Streptacidiphilus carbonis TaxID=105422 RepID=UPI000AF2F265|nr:Pls/PosA family non-ribosomal peptide synthetase [Streptacidiphilus carbonis]